MTERIKNIIENYIKNLTEENADFLGNPDADDISEQTNFSYWFGGVVGRIEPDTEDDEDATDEQIVESCESALKDIFIESMFNLACYMYNKIDVEIDQNEWYEPCADMADACFVDFSDDWERKCRKEIQDGIDYEFGKRCICVATFEQLSDSWPTNFDEPFEYWFCDQMGIERGEESEEEDGNSLFDSLSLKYCDTRFSVCVPESIKQRWITPPLNECEIHEID